MSQSVLTIERTTGVLLILSTVIPIVGAFGLALTGNLAGMYSGPEDLAIDFGVRRLTFRMASLAMILALLGFALLTTQLQAAGEPTLSLVALSFFIVASIGWILEMTITSSVGESAAKEFARTGTVPDYWEPIQHWINVSLQQVYVFIGLIAVAAYGGSLVRSGLLSTWVGWALVGWAAFWILAAVLIAIALKGGNSSYFIPGVLLLPPALVGGALLASA